MEAKTVIKKLEKMRIKIKVLYAISILMFILIVTVMAVATITEKSIPKSFLLGLVLCIIMSFFTSINKKTIKKFKILYKETFVYDLLYSMLDDVDYRPWQGLEPRNVAESGLIKLGNIYGSDDVLFASYRGIRFCQADVESRFVDENKRKSAKIYFSGRLLCFDYTYKNVNDVKVLDKNFESKIEELGNKVLLENIEFNNIFNVYSIDEEDAFYVLTPHFMEKMMSIQERYKNVAFRFTNHRLYVAISAEHAFDTPGKKKIKYDVEMARVKKHIQVVIDIVDAMKRYYEN